MGLLDLDQETLTQPGVSGIDGVSPSCGTGVEGATSVGASGDGILARMNGRNVKGFPCCGMFFGDNMNVASVTNVHNRMYLDVASSIVNLHPICDSLGCPSGMKSYATRILGSQRGFHGQGTSFGHVLVQIHLK